ncbi:hypothetical protein BHE74_00052184, partial [Ensete ventricosum]
LLLTLPLSTLLVIFAELMILGFISLLLTFGQNYIIQICIPEEAADTMLPCLKEEKEEPIEGEGHDRRLLWSSLEGFGSKYRMLVEASSSPHCPEVSASLGPMYSCISQQRWEMSLPAVHHSLPEWLCYEDDGLVVSYLCRLAFFVNFSFLFERLITWPCVRVSSL